MANRKTTAVEPRARKGPNIEQNSTNQLRLCQHIKWLKTSNHNGTTEKEGAE